MKIKIMDYFYTVNYLLIALLYILSAYKFDENPAPLYYLKYLAWLLIAFYSITILLKKKLRINKNVVIAVILVQSLHLIIFLNQKYKCFDSLFNISAIVILFFILLPDYKRYDDLVYRMVVFSFFINIIVAMSFKVDDINFQINRFTNGLRPRLRFSFNHPNYLAQLCFVILVAIFILLSQKKVNNKKVYYFISAVTLTTLVLTGSRTALFLLFLFISSFYYLEYIRKLSNRYVIILLSLVLLFFFVVMFILGISNLFDVGSMKIRLNNWMSIIDSMHNKSVLLYGIGYIKTTEIDPALVAVYNIPSNIDNSYVLMIMQSGIVGFIANLVLIYYLYSCNKLIANKRIRNLYKSLFLSFVAYGFTENHLFTIGNVFTVQIWFLLGRLLNEGKKRFETRQLS